MSVNLEHYRNLVALAAADGKIEESERVTLSKIAYQKDIPMDRMKVMLKKANEYKYFIPQNTQDRENQMSEMIELALVDNELAKAERSLILRVGRKLGFDDSEINNFINGALKNSDADVE